MKILVHLPEVAKSLGDKEFNKTAPTVDVDALVDYICGEYIFSSDIDNVLINCLDSLGSVTDYYNCDISYNKLVSTIYATIVDIYGRLDEYMIRENVAYGKNNLRLQCRIGDLYVFEFQ
jgi:hypothetical protein